MINFPTSLDSFTNPTGTDLLENSNAALDHDVQHSNANDAIEALQAKVGANSSAVTTSHDYKLSEVTSTDKAVGKTATQTLTNKTLTSPTITGATLTTSTVNGVTLSSTGSASNFLKENGTYGTATAGDASYAAKGSVQGLTDAATSGLTISSGVISVNSGTGANNILKLNSSAQIPAVDGSLLTNIVPSYFVGFQELIYSAYGSDTSPSTVRITSEADGSVMYACFISNTGSSGINLLRYARDSKTGMYYQTHNVTSSSFGGALTAGTISIAVLGSYVYVSATTSTAVIQRFAKADFTGQTSMTISGTAFASIQGASFGDGTSLYIQTSSATFYRYTISGTTATNAATVTYTSAGTTASASSDNTSVWMLDSAGSNIRKYAVAGGSATATLTSANNFGQNYPSQGSISLFIPRAGFLDVASAWVASTETAKTGFVLSCTPFTQI